MSHYTNTRLLVHWSNENECTPRRGAWEGPPELHWAITAAVEPGGVRGAGGGCPPWGLGQTVGLEADRWNWGGGDAYLVAHIRYWMYDTS